MGITGRMEITAKYKQKLLETSQNSMLSALHMSPDLISPNSMEPIGLLSPLTGEETEV